MFAIIDYMIYHFTYVWCFFTLDYDIISNNTDCKKVCLYQIAETVTTKSDYFLPQYVQQTNRHISIWTTNSDTWKTAEQKLHESCVCVSSTMRSKTHIYNNCGIAHKEVDIK